MTMPAATPAGLPPLAGGSVPLRPLSVGEVLDGGMDVLRRHPGPALGVSAAMVGVQLLITVPLWWAVTSLLSQSGSGESASTGLVLMIVTLTAGSVVAALGSTLAAVMTTAATGVAISQETNGSATSLSAALRRLRPLFGRLFALALALTGLNTLVAAIPIIGYFVPLFGGLFRLSVLAVVFEGATVGAALRRSTQVGSGTSAGLFRQLGIRLLAGLVGVLVWLIGVLPLSAITSVVVETLIGGDALANGDSGALLLLTGGLALSYYLPLIVVWAFRSGVDTLLYLDGRMRTEALDVEWGLAARQARLGAGRLPVGAGRPR